MKKLFRRVLILGALAGGVLALRNYLAASAASAEEVAQISFDDGTTRSFAANSVEGMEISSIAEKLVEIGV